MVLGDTQPGTKTCDAGSKQIRQRFRPIVYGRRLQMNTLIGALITFVVIILVLYLVNILPIDGRVKQIVQIIVILIGIISLLKYLAVF
jgi:hypothetical protein